MNFVQSGSVDLDNTIQATSWSRWYFLTPRRKSNTTMPSQLRNVIVSCKLKLPFQNSIATTTAALFEKQVSFQPRKSRRISPKSANVDGDNFTWVEILVVSHKKGSNKSRSLFYSIQTRHAFWDEPPTGASEVVFLGDLEKMNAVIARVEKQQQQQQQQWEDPNVLGVGSGGSVGSIAAAAAAREVGSGGSVSVARSISTDSASLTSAPTVSLLSSHVEFLGEGESENANTSTSTISTIVQTRKMVLLFAINVTFLIFQGMLVVWHLWPSP